MDSANDSHIEMFLYMINKMEPINNVIIFLISR